MDTAIGSHNCASMLQKWFFSYVFRPFYLNIDYVWNFLSLLTAVVVVFMLETHGSR